MVVRHRTLGRIQDVKHFQRSQLLSSAVFACQLWFGKSKSAKLADRYALGSGQCFRVRRRVRDALALQGGGRENMNASANLLSVGGAQEVVLVGVQLRKAIFCDGHDKAFGSTITELVGAGGIRNGDHVEGRVEPPQVYAKLIVNFLEPLDHGVDRVEVRCERCLQFALQLHNGVQFFNTSLAGPER